MCQIWRVSETLRGFTILTLFSFTEKSYHELKDLKIIFLHRVVILF